MHIHVYSPNVIHALFTAGTGRVSNKIYIDKIDKAVDREKEKLLNVKI